jgi:hypothetical protein
MSSSCLAIHTGLRGWNWEEIRHVLWMWKVTFLMPYLTWKGRGRIQFPPLLNEVPVLKY